MIAIPEGFVFRCDWMPGCTLLLDDQARMDSERAADPAAYYDSLFSETRDASAKLRARRHDGEDDDFTAIAHAAANLRRRQ